jgi:23S rRNA pseudouridine1911/1915/1917 synthase
VSAGGYQTRALARLRGLSRALGQERAGGTAVARKGDPARAGARVTLAAPPADAAALRPLPDPDAPLAVLHADDHLLALAKPPGGPSHPLRAGERGTLANALVARYPECAGAGADPREAGLVQRLDAGTSGALLAARDRATWDALRALFRAGAVGKLYLALVHGAAADDESHQPIRDQPASTRWTVDRRLPGYTLLRCVAQTGRMHQVRIHLAGAGHPVVGDRDYGPLGAAPAGLIGHFLHAARLELSHPRGGAALVIEAPLPPDRLAALTTIGG